MSYRIPLILSFALALAACSESEPPTPVADEATQAEPAPTVEVEVVELEIPETRTVEVVDVYHGVEVADPYRWLEEDVRESEAVAEWVAAQNRLTERVLAGLESRDWFAERLAELWNYERYGLPVKRGDRYFYTRNDGLQNQAVLYVRDGLDGEPRVLIDPNQWSEDGTVSLAQWVPGPGGRHLAYGIQDGGSDWRTWRVLDVESGEVLDDGLEWLKFTSVAWDEAGEGFYYSRYPEPEPDAQFQSLNLNQKVFYHRLGEPQADDRLVYERPDQPEWGFFPAVSDDGRYLVITIFHGTDNRYQVAYKDLEAEDAEVVMLIEGFQHDFTFVGNQGTRFLFYSNFEAPKYRVVAIDLEEPEGREVVVPEREHVLQGVSHVGGHLVAAYLEDAKSAVRIHSDDGEFVRELELPGIGTAFGFSGESDDPETFFSFSSFNRPATIYGYDVASGERSTWQQPEVGFDPEDFVVEQVFYESADGTRVPMFLARRADLSLDRPRPTMLYGYGGFNISLTPSFSVQNLAWMDAGGVFAMANLRGGGEYGREWHQAGTKTNKQNVFDDFIAAAEYLIEESVTETEHLAIYGRSNGGLLVGATVNQRPELFAAALPAVGVMDMLRFDQFTAGRFWVDDYGSPADPDEFRALYAYSPYHNIRSGADYPAVLVTTADTDDRVVPGHSFKYAAALQAADTGEEPQVIRIETRAGHGAGTPVQMLIDMYADMWGFAADHVGLRPQD
ncbi:MAG: prolyl oligopeptidase family serine peptidase [Wenzhouxiangellaceae bacterium]|nr:prolyl oligopeptidase family serine peptidase [Wenzhouxiangellaceae bacterium]